MDLLIITGPTGTGKTKMSVMAAQRLDGEIVNADAMQIYRGMDIGTAKPDAVERGGIPHHMFDVAEPGEAYSVSRYVECAGAVMKDIAARGKLPILVGGTGLYIDSLLYGRDFADTDPKLRETLEAIPDPYAELSRIDPESYAKLHPNDTRRIIRALEVFYLTGKTISAVNAENKRKSIKYIYKKFILTYKNREKLYENIDRRVTNMLERGLVSEVAGLLAKNVKTQAIGYKEIAAALAGEYSMETAVSIVRQASRNYAKRQLTWFRRDTDAVWIEWDDEPDFSRGLEILLSAWESHLHLQKGEI
jgi:tRNA dimethylallyltransferase